MHINAPFELVLFGGLGDLALRKLMPALYLLNRDGRLPEGAIYAVTRRDMDRDTFVNKIRKSVESHVDSSCLERPVLEDFLNKVHCFTLDVNDAAGYQALAATLSSNDVNRLFYMATGSDLYTPVCRGLNDAGLICSQSKIVLEKPIGHDLETAQKINDTVAEFFTEKQIYRIDHYLGKETVQNLMVLRFANSLFESQWNQHYIDHIQITISEQLGVEQRAEFYEHVGAMRDMFQNHLLQLLCITAMEPPAKLEPDAVRDEKVKVLKALKPITGELINEKVVRGQ
ncbi:MAG: glucose-6-phosphate dehydrogenase [Thalassolituus sp.]